MALVVPAEMEKKRRGPLEALSLRRAVFRTQSRKEEMNDSYGTGQGIDQKKKKEKKSKQIIKLMGFFLFFKDFFLPDRTAAIVYGGCGQVSRSEPARRTLSQTHNEPK